jgi:hypothetical protein
MMRRSPLRRKSAKREKLDVLRQAFVKERLAEQRFCQAMERALSKKIPENYEQAKFISLLAKGCTHYAIEVHEPLSRARAPGQETILDPANSLCLCHWCHICVIHEHPAVAESLGLLTSSRGRT